MLTLLHASDLHFGPPFRPEVGTVFLEQVAHLSPDVIVLSGDFTQRAKVREYEAARDWIDRLPPVPKVVTPGNHDVPLYRVFERLFAPFRNYRTYLSEALDSVTAVPGAVIVSLASAAPHHAIVNGRISPRQVAFAEEAFADAPAGEARIVVTHHHLAPAPDYEVDSELPRAREILEAFDRMGVELLLGGHLHRAYIGNSLDVHPGEDDRHGIVIVHCGTTTSRRGRAREQGRNSFNVVHVADDHVSITHHMYFDDVARFAPFSTHAFPRREDGFFTREPRGFMLEDPETASVEIDEASRRMGGGRG